MSVRPLTGTLEHFERAARLADAGLCQQCGKRRGYIPWGDSLAMTHGGGELRCGVCAYGPQLRHALGRTVAIPRLCGRLAWALLSERKRAQ